MRRIIVIREVKEVYHQIEVEMDDDMMADQIADEIDIRGFDDIDEVADYINEFATVYSVDACCDTLCKDFWYDNDYICN